MDLYIKKMFDYYSSNYIGWYGDGFIIKSRSVKLHRGGENEKTRQVLSLYNSLKDGSNLKEARIESGLNLKETRHYINLINELHRQRNGTDFYTAKLKNKKITKRLSENEVIRFISVTDEENERFLEKLENYE